MGDFQVIFMDAGQGDCTLIVYPDDTLTLVDCGSTKSGEAALQEIKKVMYPRLATSHYHLNLVFTHPDEDHYNQLHRLDEGGIIYHHLVYTYYGGDLELYRNKKDNNFTYNMLQNLAGNHDASVPDNATSTEPDGVLSRAGVDVTILAANAIGDPDADDGPTKNGNSIVLLVEYQGVKIFLMGDASVETEQAIIDAFTGAKKLKRLQKGDDETVVLKMGHHGSDTSTGSNWIKTIQPDILVVSAGTKPFSGTGMPKKSHLTATMNATKLQPDTGIDQSYVVFDQAAKKDPKFVTMAKTTKGIWTTCYDAVYKGGTSYYESGQTWYYGVDMVGKKKSNHWVGYTGYEI